jgi:DNA primase
MISQQTVDEILLAAKIEEVVGDFVALKKRGQNWVGVCPFHDDRNPSMYVSPRLGIFKCFVCDAGGNAVHFLMQHEKISYPEALLYLAKKYNIAVVDEVEKTPEQKAAQSERDSMFIVNNFAENYFCKQLFEEDEGRAIGLSYFKERGFTEETIHKFKLGYNPDGWDTFTQEALKNGYQLDLLLKLGLTKKAESSQKLFDFYRGRVIFPIHNALGKVVGFGGRTLKRDEKLAKYFNSPESEIYHKSDILYGFYFAKKSIRSKDNVYLVEGYTDVISLFQAGIENTVASSGTSLTERQVKLISSQTQNITILYDGDSAGIKASMRGIDMLLEAGLNVKVVMLPEGEDPDSFARTQTKEALATYLQTNETDFLLFKVKVMTKEAGNDPMKRAKIVNEIIETVATVRDQIARSFYIKECAQLFSLSEEILNMQLRKAVLKKINQPKTDVATETVALPQIPLSKKESISKTNPLEQAEKSVILLILKYGMYEIDIEVEGTEGKLFYEKRRVDQYVFDELHEESMQFTNPLYQHIFEEYALVAPGATCQDNIKKHFLSHEQKALQDFTISQLINADPEYSPDWENRFEMETNTVSNNIQRLNSEVENCLNQLKLRLLERYNELLLSELSQNHPQEVLDSITAKLMMVLDRRKEIAKLLGIVVTK